MQSSYLPVKIFYKLKTKLGLFFSDFKIKNYSKIKKNSIK